LSCLKRLVILGSLRFGVTPLHCRRATFITPRSSVDVDSILVGPGVGDALSAVGLVAEVTDHDHRPDQPGTEGAGEALCRLPASRSVARAN
jgi:hypothetical protein